MEIKKDERLEDLRKKAEANKGKEYKWLYGRFSFALIKDGHIAKIGSKALSVYLVIFTYKDRENTAYPSLKTISKHTGLSINSVRQGIKILVEENWLSANRIRSGEGKYLNTNYELLELNLIRGSEGVGFIDKPIAEIDNGD